MFNYISIDTWDSMTEEQRLDVYGADSLEDANKLFHLNKYQQESGMAHAYNVLHPLLNALAHETLYCVQGSNVKDHREHLESLYHTFGIVFHAMARLVQDRGTMTAPQVQQQLATFKAEYYMLVSICNHFELDIRCNM